MQIISWGDISIPDPVMRTLRTTGMGGFVDMLDIFHERKIEKMTDGMQQKIIWNEMEKRGYSYEGMGWRYPYFKKIIPHSKQTIADVLKRIVVSRASSDAKAKAFDLLKNYYGEYI